MAKFKPAALPGTLHNYAERLVAFEHAPQAKGQGPTHYLLWLGGLTDGLRTVSYPLAVQDLLSKSSTSAGTWSLVEVLLSSSYSGWETSDLVRDADELSQAVNYFRSLQAANGFGNEGRIVLMGHSTGCQIATHYVVGPHLVAKALELEPTSKRPKIDGVILQAGISDREAIAMDAEASEGIEAGLARARELVKAGKGDDRMPGFLFGCPTVRRYLSLVSSVPEEADDDYFSSDLSDERVTRVWGQQGFGGTETRQGGKLSVMVLLSGSDQYMPPAVDKAALTEKWGDAVKAAGGNWDERSGPVPGAGHNLNNSDEAAVKELCERVAAFVKDVV